MSSVYLSAIQHYCAYQERCHSEVRYKLVTLGARGAELEEIISTLVQDNFLDEERYARTYVRSKFCQNQWGRIKIKQGLQQKQVSEYCIRKGFTEIDEAEYIDLINLLAAKKWQILDKESNEYQRKAKTTRYLLQKGFEHEYIKNTLDNIETI